MKKQFEDEEGVIPPHPPHKISFRKAFQYIANKIEGSCKQPTNPRLAKIKDGAGGTIASVISQVDYIPESPLTGLGRISWEDAIYLMLKQEGHVFEVREIGGKGGPLSLQV